MGEGKKTFKYLVINGVELRENNSINEARLFRHGVISQSLIELYLRTQGREREMSHLVEN